MTIAAPHTAAPPGATESDKARGASAGQVGEQIKAGTSDCTEAGDECKSLATLKAQAARAGYLLHELADGGFIITRWAQSTRALPDLRSVRAVMSRMGIAE